MTVKDLREMLEEYPDEMEILNGRYSDYVLISRNEWSIVKGVPNNNGWVMRSHNTMSDENKKKEKSYLHLEGN
jgi:hypothetical protein